jgi:hypothetical protein
LVEAGDATAGPSAEPSAISADRDPSRPDTAAKEADRADRGFGEVKLAACDVRAAVNDAHVDSGASAVQADAHPRPTREGAVSNPSVALG